MNQTEEYLFHLVNSLSGRYQVLDQFMFRLSDSMTWNIAAVAFYSYAYATKNRDLTILFWCAMLCVAFSDFISFEIIKPIVARERPCWMPIQAVLIEGKCGGSYGFTSNHAANAFAVWAVVAHKHGAKSKLAIISLILATLISISRVFLGVHFVGDIVGGGLLGAAVAAVLWRKGLNSWAVAITNRTGPKVTA
jgi:undecaprenyl-diphosphatase